jgi:archaellum component FlaG (FlaF/FlaG flagellin family)
LDKAMTTVFMVIASVVCAILVFNSLYPAVIRSSDAMTSMTLRVDDRLKSQIEIIHAAGSGNNALVWVKNVGSLRIAAVESCDIFFGPEGSFNRIPYGSGASYWTYEVENASEWTPTATLKITIVNGGPLSGRYFVKVIIPNGIYDEYYFSE